MVENLQNVQNNNQLLVRMNKKQTKMSYLNMLLEPVARTPSYVTANNISEQLPESTVHCTIYITQDFQQ
jgi:hypothetical protein